MAHTAGRMRTRVLDDVEQTLCELSNADSGRRGACRARLRALCRELGGTGGAQRPVDEVLAEIERAKADLRGAETIALVHQVGARIRRLNAELALALGHNDELRSILGLR